MSHAKEGVDMRDISLKSFGATWLALLALALFLCPPAEADQSLPLAWSPSASPGVAGYVINYGTDATNLNSQMDVGTNTNVTVTGLQAGTTNYFEVVAYDVFGDQSPPSNLIDYTVPTAVSLATQTVTAQTNGTTEFTLLMSGDGTFEPNLRSTIFEAGKRYTLTAKAAKGFVFAGWISNGVVISTSSKYSLLLGSNVVLRANFVPNPFMPAVASYHGLFYVPNDASVESSGAISASVTSTGAYSARLGVGAASYVLSGEFSPLTGLAFNSIPRRGLTPITVQLQLDFSNGPITGSISDGAWAANLMALPSIYSRTNPAPQVGKYTLVFPGSDNASAQPGGNGFGAVTVNTLGDVSLSGTLGDGTPFTSSSVVAGEGRWPFYVSLYGGKGSILGWLSFTNGDNINGQIEWFKQPISTAKLYPGGFTNGTEAIGSVYHFTNEVPVLGSVDASLSLINGDLDDGVTNQVALGPYIPATEATTTKLSCSTSSGIFYGSVINPETGKAIAIHGVVLQNQNFGAGYFLGTNQSGSVLLSPTP
jgi:hypothetical protein